MPSRCISYYHACVNIPLVVLKKEQDLSLKYEVCKDFLMEMEHLIVNNVLSSPWIEIDNVINILVTVLPEHIYEGMS